MEKKEDKKVKSPTLSTRVIRKQIAQTRSDIENWRNAVRLASAAEPKMYLLQRLYADVMQDALLSSQVDNRYSGSAASAFELVDPSTGRVDDALTATLRSFTCLPELFRAILDADMYGYSLVELSQAGGVHHIEAINRENVSPATGRFYPDATGSTFINYRSLGEYGGWLLEFKGPFPARLNKATPHVLFKKFAQSCWSELCEIYGIPPRYMKTNTTDQQMLDRAEAMMRDIGAAAWFIIDTTEEFNFANPVNTSGEVYQNLIRLCNNELSMLVSGAIIGQDTENGNRSKEETSKEMLAQLVAGDCRRIEAAMNATVLPAFIRIGWTPVNDRKFRFASAQDVGKLWEYTRSLLPFKDVDSAWITEKFGVPVADRPAGDQLRIKNYELRGGIHAEGAEIFTQREVAGQARNDEQGQARNDEQGDDNPFWDGRD